MSYVKVKCFGEG